MLDDEQKEKKDLSRPEILNPEEIVDLSKIAPSGINVKKWNKRKQKQKLKFQKA
jgi:hypothetical protein